MSFLLRNEYRPEESGVDMHPSPPRGAALESMWLMFKTRMFIYQSKANLDEKISFGKITHHLDPERGLYGNLNVPFWSMIYVAFKFTLSIFQKKTFDFN